MARKILVASMAAVAISGTALRCQSFLQAASAAAASGLYLDRLLYRRERGRYCSRTTITATISRPHPVHVIPPFQAARWFRITA